jgi:hypothetical protein
MDAHHERFRRQVQTLCSVSLAGLPRMIDPATGLVAFRVDGDELVPSGASVRYTAITLLGLERAARAGLAPSLDVDRLYDALEATLAGVVNAGDLGLVAWCAATTRPELAERALRELAEIGDLSHMRGSRTTHATELAWVVIGLAEALMAGAGNEQEISARLDRAFARLLEMRGDSGLLAFARPLGRAAADPRALLQGELGFFDAQVYGIVACLARDAAVGDADARATARVIAERLLAHQHPLGQWGWHYNVRTGALVDLYPVYSVHQDGMAPLALLPLERVLDIPTAAAIARGVDWLFGKNELGAAMVDEERNVIWRSIRRRTPHRRVVYALKAASLARVGRSLDLGARLAEPETLEIDRESRPYHLGWCLYALADLAARETYDDSRFGSEPRPTLKTGEISASSRGSRASHSA